MIRYPRLEYERKRWVAYNISVDKLLLNKLWIIRTRVIFLCRKM